MKLEKEEVKGIFGVLIHTMDLDHARSEDERAFLARFLTAIGQQGLDLEELAREVKEHPDVDWHVARIASRKGRIYALQQALLLALADGDYQVVERDGLKALAEKLGIDDVLFEAIEKWAMEGAAWQIQGAALLAR